MRNSSLPPRLNRFLPCSGLLSDVRWFETDVSSHLQRSSSRRRRPGNECMVLYRKKLRAGIGDQRAGSGPIGLVGCGRLWMGTSGPVLGCCT